MRIRDIEKDINNLNSNLDDITIQIQDLIKIIKTLKIISSLLTLT